jgi:hypothetical protein
MASEMYGYLELVDRGLHLELGKRTEILNELKTHIEDRADELVQEGKSSEDALRHAVDGLGPSRVLAEGFYAVHARGPWHHTALAVLPHVLLALTYAYHLWTNPAWVGGMLVVALATSVVGWRKGRPSWAYPWLGYSLAVPMVSWGLAMSAVGYGAWGILTSGALPLGVPIYLASFIYIIVSLWVVIKFVSKVARPDWVMASLAVLPVPFLAYWFFFFYNWGFQDQTNFDQMKDVDTSATIVFLLIAGATAVFYRVGKRLVRVALLLITAPSMIVLAWMSYQGGRGYLAVFTFAAISLAVLLSPVLFDRKSTSVGQTVRPSDVTPSGLPGTAD